jgi:dolichol-phosphate mannosyltransferase
MANPNDSHSLVAVVIPAYRVTRHVIEVIKAIGPEVTRIYVVDDACPDQSGDHVRKCCCDSRVIVLRHRVNQGVGGAVITGYRAAVRDGMNVIVKIDGDGQMNPALVPRFIRPILEGWADYTKGNRFYEVQGLERMPRVRLFGNAILSLLTKMSSGYWNIFDPTNGYTAIDARVAAVLPYERISRRYFFESDMLFRLGTLRCAVADIPMRAVYEDEVSSLRVTRVIGEFLNKHATNVCKRLFYNYCLRDMTVASFELVLGTILLLFGLCFGAYHWLHAIISGEVTPLGTIMFAVLPVVLGVQFLLAFINYDVSNVPSRAVASYLSPPVSCDHEACEDQEVVESNRNCGTN